MARCFEESQRAYTSGDGAKAKVLSNEGKEHKAKMEQLHAEASSWIYASELRWFFSPMIIRRSHAFVALFLAFRKQ